MTKSYVTIEQKHCPICGENKESGALLLDRRVQDSFEKHTVTGIDICDDCDAQSKKGFVALIGADPEKSRVVDETCKPQDAYRTEEYLWIDREFADKIFDVDLGDHPFAYIEPEAMKMVKQIVKEITDES